MLAIEREIYMSDKNLSENREVATHEAALVLSFENGALDARILHPHVPAGSPFPPVSQVVTQLLGNLQLMSFVSGAVFDGKLNDFLRQQQQQPPEAPEPPGDNETSDGNEPPDGNEPADDETPEK